MKNHILSLVPARKKEDDYIDLRANYDFLEIPSASSKSAVVDLDDRRVFSAPLKQRCGEYGKK